MIGTTLSHYKILEKLGAGGMGEVYRAEDTTLKRQVALKVLPPELAASQERLERFQREAETLAALDHPNIVTIHAVEQADSVHFLIMPFVEGRTLDQLIPPGGLPFERFLDLAVQLADALRAAHEQGIIHRDLKPANVMVDGEDRLRMLDFGLAKLLPETASPEMSQLPTLAVTEEGVILGTYPYMSPEQAEGRPVDERSDLFSLGILLYEMATGKRPFRGETAAAMISSILKDTPSPVTEERPQLPRHLGRIIGRCLEKDPRRRVQSALDLRNQLEALTIEARSVPEIPHREPSAFEEVAQVASIVVLPFENMTPDQQNEYFSDGLTEEIITDLSKVRHLRVISRTSSMMLKGSHKDPKTIGRKLKVRYVLEGGVRKSGNRLRITAQLIDATDDMHLWAEKYSGTLEDVFDIQETLSHKIVDALKVKLSPEEVRLVGKRAVKPAAHEAYLQGRYHLDKATPAELNKAVKYFDEATEIDPDYAAAYAGSATSYNYLGWLGGVAREVFPQAKRAAVRALEIDETLAEAHSVLGYTSTFYDWDWAAAERHLQRAIELNPSYAQAHLHYSWYLGSQGRLEEARATITRASELDPLSLVIHANLANYFSWTRDYDEMLQQIQRTLELAPDLTLGLLFSGMAYWGKELYDDAVVQYEKLVDRVGSAFKGYLGYSYARGGHHSRALEILEELKELSREEYVPCFQIALVFIGLEQLDEALAWLEKAYEERGGPWFPYIRLESLFDPLRTEPRFQDLVRRMNFPD